MPKPCVLIAGPAIAADTALIKELQGHASVLKTRAYSEIAEMVEHTQVDLLLLEVATADRFALSVIRNARSKAPDMAIILINGDGNREVIARAFTLGATDVFAKPYNRALLVERVWALLRQR
jgi:DNA-binding response OmpR family regulator